MRSSSQRTETPCQDLLKNVGMTYTQGVLENSIPSVGQVAGRIETLVPAAEIIENTVKEFAAVISQLEKRYLLTS